MEEKTKEMLNKLLSSYKINVTDACTIVSLNRNNYEEGALILNELIDKKEIIPAEVEEVLSQQICLTADMRTILHTFIAHVPLLSVKQVLDLVFKPTEEETVAILNVKHGCGAIPTEHILTFLDYQKVARENEAKKKQVEESEKQQQQTPETWPINVPNYPCYPQFPSTSPYPWEQVWYTTRPWELDQVYCQCGHCNTAK